MAAVEAARADGPTWSEAGRRSGVDAATVYTVVKRFGEISETTLFVTGPDGRERPTPEAEQLYAAALPVVAAYRAFVSSAHGFDELPVVRFSSFPSHIELFAASVISSRSDCSVSVVALFDERRVSGGRELIEDLEAGRVDVVIAPEPGPQGRGIEAAPLRSVHRESLYRYTLLAVDYRHELATRKAGSPVSSLAGHRLLTSPLTHSSRALLDSAASLAQVHLDIAGESTNVPAMLALGRFGMGIPIVPNDSLPHDFLLRAAESAEDPSPRLVPVLDSGGGTLGRDYFVWWREVDQRNRSAAPIANLVSDLKARCDEWERHQDEFSIRSPQSTTKRRRTR